MAELFVLGFKTGIEECLRGAGRAVKGMIKTGIAEGVSGQDGGALAELF